MRFDSALAAPSVDYRLPHSPLGIQKASFRLLSLLPRFCGTIIITSLQSRDSFCGFCDLTSLTSVTTRHSSSELDSALAAPEVLCDISIAIPLLAKGHICEIRNLTMLTSVTTRHTESKLSSALAAPSVLRDIISIWRSRFCQQNPISAISALSAGLTIICEIFEICVPYINISVISAL